METFPDDDQSFVADLVAIKRMKKNLDTGDVIYLGTSKIPFLLQQCNHSQYGTRVVIIINTTIIA